MKEQRFLELIVQRPNMPLTFSVLRTLPQLQVKVGSEVTEIDAVSTYKSKHFEPIRAIGPISKI